jgi:hypothetical protein
MKMALFWVVVWYEFTNVSELCTASINGVMMETVQSLMMEAVQTSETLVNPKNEFN